ncbi:MULTISPECIES: hypothetical protein [Agrobacterium]|uniref:hypothetical protein n=1 Tax=Agrobacterium TaxID=357 RepID=UPI001573F1CE|nr:MULTISPECIES: hypothetical protein [Agrobacterium]MCD4659448.1 hypothetical protein [Agrobacterium sp.]NTE53808.1 hypothetical protein [Agrobacterium tumefaciens]NTE70563.1 hypothetical protein [Agrobacterium tumefaciens]
MSDDDLTRDQRTRRAGEIRSAALAYVRECGRQRRVFDVEEFAQRRWPRDGVEKRTIMTAALRDDVHTGVPVVDVWQRFEVSGAIARQLIGARSYGDLYRVLMVNEMPVGYRPGDVAAWVTAGKMSVGDGMEILGIESADEFDAFLAAWTVGEN